MMYLGPSVDARTIRTFIISFPRFTRPMLDADSVVLDLPASPVVAAAFAFHYHSKLDADSIVSGRL